MKHYHYQDRFKQLYDKSVALYAEGQRDKTAYFDEDELAFIQANGWRVQDFYDYAEDFVVGGVPSYEIAQSIEQARREYFLHTQKGLASNKVVQGDALPPKAEEVEGIAWLPRIIQKALGKMKGELCDEIMYCCGGDRRFLSSHDIHPAEFLRLAITHENNPQAIVDFVKSRRAAVVA